MVVLVVVGSGAPWESSLLGAVDRRPDVVLLKRCVDVDDLLATAAAGQAEVAVVGLDSPGFDAPAVDHLRHHGVRAVAVAPGGTSVEAGRARGAQVGADAVVPAGDVHALLEAVVDTMRVAPSAPSPPWAPSGDPEVRPGTESGSGLTVAVWGPAGAPGRSTVAAGLAALIARHHATTLVDADPYGGSLAQALGVLDEVSGLLAASRLAVSGELEARFGTVVRALTPGLDVVTGLPRPDRWAEVRPGTLAKVVAAAQRHGHVVVDTGFSTEEDPARDHGSRPGRNQLTVEALTAADEVVAVGTADPVGLSRLARGLADLRETVGVEPGRVVVNRMRPSLGWGRHDVEAVLAGFVRTSALHVVPDDREAADRALASGRSLVECAPDAPLTRALADLAQALVPAPGASALRRVRRRRAGTAHRR